MDWMLYLPYWLRWFLSTITMSGVAWLVFKLWRLI